MLLLIPSRGCSISIHALRGEGDFPIWKQLLFGFNFYPRPPWGGRLQQVRNLFAGNKFLSTPSVGRATNLACHQYRQAKISIHALRGEGDVSLFSMGLSDAISIHALRGEGDPAFLLAAARRRTFLSTPSVGRATAVSQHREPVVEFLSTPSVGRATGSRPQCPPPFCYFYPRPPWGGRLIFLCNPFDYWQFLSTPSVGRATPQKARKRATLKHFYPRPPWGGRPTWYGEHVSYFAFLSTPSVGRATAESRGRSC